MKCPVCKTHIADPPLDHLRQRSYEGKPEYISPRCLQCYKKAERKLLRKKEVGL